MRATYMPVDISSRTVADGADTIWRACQGMTGAEVMASCLMVAYCVNRGRVPPPAETMRFIREVSEWMALYEEPEGERLVAH